MEWPALFTLLILTGVLLSLALDLMPADMTLLAALGLLLLSGVLEPASALAGFANPGVITIGILYVVAGGLRETGAIQLLARLLLGNPRNPQAAQLRLLMPTSLASAFMNNTAVVAMFIPAVQDWSQRLGIPASRLLIPLSYATILGGTCTLIGTSTNLVVDGLLQNSFGLQLGLFDLLPVGLPLLLAGGLFLVLAAPRLLPDNGGLREELEKVREYGVEMQVMSGGPLVGKTVVQAGLRALQHGFLTEIERNGQLITVVDPARTLLAGDRLYFIGAPECASELRRIRGLLPASGNVGKLEVKIHQRCLVEVVLGKDFASLGQTIRDSRFRSRFNAVILSVSRQGKRIPGKLGDIRLQSGDSLLLEASDQFVAQYRYRRDFLLVSALNNSTPPDFRKAPLALGILGAMIALTACGLLSILESALLAAAAMLLGGCLTASRARHAVDYSVLTVIAASFALGQAMSQTGAAQWLANSLLQLGPLTPWLALALVYLLTALLTELITNNAAAVLMFPVGVEMAARLDANVLPFAIAIMFAASASFITPFGYQTNLMVYGPGRYRFIDFVRIGVPMSVLAAVVSIALIPLAWPL